MPQRKETPEAGVEDLEAGPRASPRRRETSVDKSDATTDEDTSTRVSCFPSQHLKVYQSI